MVAELRPEHSSQWGAIGSVAEKLGIGNTQTLANWVNQDQVDRGQRPEVTTDAAEELPKLRAENRELMRTNEILKSASTFFAAELDRRNR